MSKVTLDNHLKNPSKQATVDSSNNSEILDHPPQPHNKNNDYNRNSQMATIQQPPRYRQRSFSGRICILVVLAGLVMLGLMSGENMGQLEMTASQQAGAVVTNMDINSPPLKEQTVRSSRDSFWDEVLDRPAKQTASANSANTFPWFNWAETSSERDKKHKRAHTGHTNMHHHKPIPIIDENDDRVPQAVAGAIIRAADALSCRESVIDYVINATDLKDECDGLKRAYTKNCGGDGEDETEATQARRRHLQTHALMNNPVVVWKMWLHRKAQAFRRYWRPTAFLVEDEILEEWEGALLEVEYGGDLYSFVEVDSHVSIPRSRRQLNEATDFSDAAERLDQREQQEQLDKRDKSETADSEAHLLAEAANKTKIVVKEKVKLSNLELPTTKQHVSEKMLGETLLLQQEDKIMADVKAATSNVTAAAVADAAKSTKAVADALDFVSSVLNDPSSVEARTCCTSILNVFHEACSVDAEEEISDARLFIVVAVIALCGMVKSLIRHFEIRWLPEAAGCILVGVASGWGLSFYPHHDLSFDGKWFLRILVPPIVFEASLSIDKRSFNRHVVPIMFYAVIGTLMSTAVTAWIVYHGSHYFSAYCDPIPIVESLAFGSLISSIDPIAVLSVLSNMGMTNTDTIYVVIFGESLLNDGVAIVLYQTIVQFLNINLEVDGDAVTAAAIHFLVVAVGSLLVGLMGGICCTVYYWAFHGCQTPLVEVLMFCCWALLPYYICDGIEWSGIVAVVAAGFVMDVQVIGQKLPSNDATMNTEKYDGTRRERRQRHRPIFSQEGHLSREAKSHIGFVTEIIATMVETVIFAYLGLFLFSSRYHWNMLHTVIAIAACCLSRAVMIPCLSTIANWVTRFQQVRQDCIYQQLPQQEKDPLSATSINVAGVIIDKKMQLVLWFAGLRGAMSFALIEDIPTYDTVTGEGTRLKSELKAMTSACIIFTVFVLGGLTYYMMDGLGLAPSKKRERTTAFEKEMEMIGLLGGSHTFRTDEDTDDGDKDFETSNDMPPTSQGILPVHTLGNSRFRQRSPQPTI